LREHADRSRAAIEGRVGEPTFDVDGRTGRPVQITPVHIVEVLHGEPIHQGVIAVRQFRGVTSGTFVEVAGDARLRPGDRVILFVRNVGDRWYLTSLGQSAFIVDESHSPATVRRDVEGLWLVPEVPDMPLPELPTLASDLRAAIRALGPP
jgi:hypothetical protein